ncbi:adhesion G-protein coupled receptor G7 [Poecilia reticulata]|uniref:adhesion G-protein coupled receptor G7 n=1 Tax=Poecilia reticulata TaxID=8081 RepID=UPI0007EBC5BB|nr:PREDICTED: adhesion G-protein coupled receptor G7 [Poecilia reticulata]
MQFRVTLPNKTSLHDFSCVFWDYGKQDWNTHGCRKGNTSDGVLRCSCNHTTNFAALWSFRENYEYAEALGVLSIVGLSFSILGLVITIIHHLKETDKPEDLQPKILKRVPAVVTAITLAATYRVENPLAYRQEEFCWLAALDLNQKFSFGKPMFWAFIVPLGLVLLYNAVLLGLTSLTTCRVDHKLNSTKRSSLTQKFLVSFSLAVLLGLSWTLGYLVLVTMETANLACSVLFCLCTTTQGLQIFILFTARTRSFRAAASRSARRLSAAGYSLRSTTYHLWKNRGESRTSDMYRNTKDRDTKNEDTSI